VAGACECGNEPSGSIKKRGISWPAENRLAAPWSKQIRAVNFCCHNSPPLHPTAYQNYSSLYLLHPSMSRSFKGSFPSYVSLTKNFVHFTFLRSLCPAHIVLLFATTFHPEDKFQISTLPSLLHSSLFPNIPFCSLFPNTAYSSLGVGISFPKRLRLCSPPPPPNKVRFWSFSHWRSIFWPEQLCMFPATWSVREGRAVINQERQQIQIARYPDTRTTDARFH